MLTLAELRDLLWTSAYVQANSSKAYKTAFDSEYLSIAGYFSGGSRPDPSSYSKMGRVLVGLEDHRRLHDEHTPMPAESIKQSAAQFS